MIQSIARELPTDRLRKELEGLLSAAAQSAVTAATSQLGSVTERLTDYAERGGGPAVQAAAGAAKAAAQGKSPVRGLLGGGLSGLGKAAKQALGGGGKDGKGKGGGKKLKVTNIVEQVDVGVPRDVAYNVWTEFGEFPSFMKKVENVSQEEDNQLAWTAQILWSHRNWKSTITEQVPDERIVWRSEGAKGYVDGSVTFHAITPDLTRILVVLEYHPRGFFEGTGNLWRAQGRRVRLELKHYRRHVMTQVLLHPDEVEGWRGEIRDGEVVRQPGEEEGEQDGAAEGEAGRDSRAAHGDRDEDREDAGDEDGDTEDEYEDRDETEDDEGAEDDEDDEDEYEDSDYGDEDEWESEEEEDEDSEDDDYPEGERARGNGEAPRRAAAARRR